MLDADQVEPAVGFIGGVLRRHAAKLRAFVQRRVPAEYVDDVLQTAAVRAVERSSSLTERACVLPWLYRLHRNVIADALRQRASRERLVDSSANLPDSPAAPSQDLCRCSLVQAQRLNPAYAQMLALVDAGEATVSEAAAELGISANSAAVRLHRARKALREAMLQHWGVQRSQDCLHCRCVFEGCCEA